MPVLRQNKKLLPSKKDEGVYNHSRYHLYSMRFTSFNLNGSHLNNGFSPAFCYCYFTKAAPRLHSNGCKQKLFSYRSLSCASNYHSTLPIHCIKYSNSPYEFASAVSYRCRYMPSRFWSCMHDILLSKSVTSAGG